MIINLYTMHDEKNKLNKTLSNSLQLEGTLKQETSVINPSIIIENINPTTYNYVFIPEFGRYYFITDIESIRTNIWRIHATVDVLMSFNQAINNCDVILSDTEKMGDESYMSGEQWRTLVKSVTDVINFPNGLNSTGEYILITSGGIAHGN